MKKILITACLLGLPFFAQAHEVKKSGTLEILSHREPDDSPIAREPAILYFSVTDSKDKFKFSDCDCSVAISLGGEGLLERKLTAADEAPDWGINVAKVDYVFPKLGLYTLTIQGKPKISSFNDFKLDYDVRIDREPANDPGGTSSSSGRGVKPNFLQNYYVIGGAVLIFGIITYEVTSKLRKKNK
jgi:hypothetical protein